MENKKDCSWTSNAALIVGLTLGVFCLIGSAYHGIFLSTLGIPPGSVELSFEGMATLGAHYYLVVGLIFASIILGVACFRPLKKLTKKINRKFFL